jgi:hypothetical protein
MLPIHYAIEFNQAGLLQHFLSVLAPSDAFAMTDPDGNTIIHFAVLKESWACLLVIISSFDLNDENLSLQNA